MDEPDTYLWWQKGIIYQVYPRSFMDTDGDGVGDLPGIMRRLDYLEALGVNAIWISPIYSSPMADFGYDVSDYTAIHPLFGTMGDFDRLLEAAHERGLKVILDFVPNHTSEKHPWFLESRSSRNSPKRDWYLWADPKPNGNPPNNWLSVFGGSAWTWDEKTEQYYYHAYLKEQPDLNWRNPDVREAMFDVMRFWLDKGVDGFRVDVLWHLIKDEQLRDNPINPDYEPGEPPYRSLLPKYTTDRPEVQDAVTMMRDVLDQYDERVMIGEIYLPVEKLVTYYGKNSSGAHLPFNFQLIQLSWDACKIAEMITEYEGLLPDDGWPNWVLSNHDKSRIASRVGRAQMRVAAMLLLTLRGTPTMYYGDEIGMYNVEVPPERVQDPREKRQPEADLGRDPVRTPMQWNASAHAGFTTGSPWLPLADDYRTVNVAAECGDPTSMLTLCRRLIALRHREQALALGAYTPIDASGDVLAYVRTGNERRFLIALNLGDRPQELPLTRYTGHIVLTTALDREGEAAEEVLSLRPNEGIVTLLD